jgi:hypothetical protein
MKKNCLLSLALVGLFTLSACSIETERCSDVNQDRIYQLLSALYDAETDETSATAKFTFGGFSGTTLELVDNCEVEHDSISLSKQTFLGTSYTGSKDGQVNTHTFTFTDNQGRTYSNSGTIQATAFNSPPSSISKASGATIAFTGGALEELESVTLSITREVTENGATSVQLVSTTEDDEGATSVTLSASTLTDLSKGTAKMELRRTIATDVTEGTDVGGSVQMHYDTAPINVEITD